MRVESAQLAYMLTDLVATASKPEDSSTTAVVLLHSARGHSGGLQEGRCDLLVGTSTNRVTVGHTWVRSEGQLSGPMLWPVNDVHNLIAALKRKTRGEKEDSGDKHAVKIGRVGALVEVIENPAQRDLFGEKLWSTRFPAGDLDDYPRGVWDLLATGDRREALPVTEGHVVVNALPRTDIDPAALAPFVTIAKRRGWDIETYRRHQRLPVHIQIGPVYRGLLLPKNYADGVTQVGNGTVPDADIHDPGLPPRPVPVPLDAVRVDLDAQPEESTEDGAE